MSWFKKEVTDWDLVGKTLPPLPVSLASLDDDDDDEGEEVEFVVATDLKDGLFSSPVDPNAALLKDLKEKAEALLAPKE